MIRRTDSDVRNELIAAASGLTTDGVGRSDLKIAATALSDLRQAFGAYGPYRDRRKVCILGSARTASNAPAYEVARAIGEHFARRDWLVVTGAGPGIMQGAMEGAGVEHSFGVGIELPFEFLPNGVIAGDSKYVRMTHFFTRKLMLMKESVAYIALPGGFGTLDELFEIITLIQTGKARPAPIVLLDTPGGTFWSGLQAWITSELVGGGMVTAGDDGLYTITDSVDTATSIVHHFYSNFQSIRDVTVADETRRIIRLRKGPSAQQLIEINSLFSAVCESGVIEIARPSDDEIADKDGLAFDRISFIFNKRRVAVLRALIDHLNGLPAV